jgi:hypothetical protein
MVITTVGNNMVIELPKDLIDVTVVQAFLDYLRYKSIVSKSQATEEDIQRLTAEINESLAERNKVFV